MLFRSNVLKATIYYFLVAICSNFILRSIYLYKVFPEVMYLFWILFISLGSTMHFVNNQIQRLISVSVPFLLNLIFIVYALSVSGDFPHLLSDGELYSWNYLHYLNLHFLLSPILMLKSMYYFRYLVILITSSAGRCPTSIPDPRLEGSSLITPAISWMS